MLHGDASHSHQVNGLGVNVSRPTCQLPRCSLKLTLLQIAGLPIAVSAAGETERALLDSFGEC